MKQISSALIALGVFLPALSTAAVTSFTVDGLGADPLDGSGWGYRADLQGDLDGNSAPSFSASADFVPVGMGGSTPPPVPGFIQAVPGEGALVINGNTSGKLRTASLSNFISGISLASSIGNIDYRWQSLTTSGSPNVKFELFGIDSTFLGSVYYGSANASVGTWVTESDIETANQWFGSSNTYYTGGGYQTLAGVLANIDSNWAGDLSQIYVTSAQVGIGSTGSGGTPISGAVDWISFDVEGAGFGAATIATNFIPEPTAALGGILCMLGLGIRRRSR